MQKRRSFFNNEMEQRFSLRKYTIGLCSVCLGFVTIGMGSQSVKADTVNNVEKSSVVQENKMQDADSATAKPNITPTETKKNEVGSVATTAPKTNTTSNGVKANTADSATSAKTKLTKANSTLANSNIISAQAKSAKAELVVQPKVSVTSTEAKLNEPSSAVVKPNGTSKGDKPNTVYSATLIKIKPRETKLAKTVDAKVFDEAKVATDNQFNFDDWTTQIDNTYLNITGYKGDRSKQIVVPNGADFAKAGKNDKNLQVEIGKKTLADLIVDGVAPRLSNADGKKIVAKGGDWDNAFSQKHLHDISGLANLDTSNVTNMSHMFYNNRISDLSPLANWNTSKVTDMSYMFTNNQISDLSPLANWNTSKATDMSFMLYNNRISDLSPLANWNTGNVTNMSFMFDVNQISDLSPLAGWNTGNVTNMRQMFYNNRISDLSPLANWGTGNVTDMSSMFDENQISDLSPLANWDTGKVTDMSSMFSENQISDLSPLAGWNTGKVTNMSHMFYNNRISDLSPLANWGTGNVTDMSSMFDGNQISDLRPLANWNTGNVTNMTSMFDENQISDLSPLAGWDTGKVTDMSYMFSSNQISDLSPLAGWNTGNVTDMDHMFYYDPLNSTINSQSTLNKFHAVAYKLDNIGALASHSENKTFNDGSQILLDKNVITEKDSATLTFKANGLAGNTYQIKIYNPNKSINIQAAVLPTALGTTDASYKDGYTIITNKFINNGSVKQDISITQYTPYPDRPNFAQYESTSGLITVVKDKEDLGLINIAYQNVADISKSVSAPYVGNKPYINHTQSTFYFQPRVDYAKNAQYSFIKSAGLTITVPDDVTIDPNTFIDIVNGKILQATKIADNQYRVVLNNTTDGITVKGLINVPADKLANGTAHLSGFSAKYTINTYNDKMAPLVATDTSKELSVIPDLKSYHGNLININQSKWAFDRNGNEVDDYTSQGFTNEFDYDLLNSAISTQITNGVETLNIPTGVNITKFGLKFDNNVIDHIDYIYTDGSRQTASSFSAVPKAIRQMKVYFKNGIQSDVLSDIDPQKSNIKLSFDAAYPDGTPIKNFDTFNITGSFSCDELGSTGNVDIAQIMLVPTQTLTDGMLTDTNQDESNKAPNANGNSINAIIRNDGLPQHQGHLTNPIFILNIMI
ncbi:BspA family leucine-rich repeat surface protein [Lactobacillus crispatus]